MLLALILPLATNLSASAAPTITYYPITIGNGATDHPGNITVGPDGALWFTDTPGIGRMTTSGAFSPFLSVNAGKMVNGPDGNLWFLGGTTSSPVLDSMDTSENITSYPITGSYNVVGSLTVGSDGNFWFLERATTGSYPTVMTKMTATGTITRYTLPSIYVGEGGGITTGADGNVWFAIAYSGGYKIGSITPSGTMAFFSTTVTPYDMAVGPDGNVWFTSAHDGVVDRITSSGTITTYALPSGYYPKSITAGQDGALWFNAIDIGGGDEAYFGRITTTGSMSLYDGGNAATYSGITSTSDGTLWATEGIGNAIVKVVPDTPNAPANLAADSPVRQPSLTWDAATRATSYNIYRNGTLIDSTTNTNYTDTNAPEGTDTYYVTGVNSNGESGPSNVISVVVDRTAPVVSVTPDAGSTLSGTENFTVTVTDNESLDPSKNTAVWVYLRNTAGAQKTYGYLVDLSSGTGTFSVNTSVLDNGDATLDVGIVQDATGNASGTTDNLFTGYTIDN